MSESNENEPLFDAPIESLKRLRDLRRQVAGKRGQEFGELVGHADDGSACFAKQDGEDAVLTTVNADGSVRLVGCWVGVDWNWLK